MAIRCQPCQAVLGAEVEGVDLRQVPDAATIDVLEEALERYGVLIFHAQHLTPEEQVAWSRAFGPLAMTRGLRHACRTARKFLSWAIRSTLRSPFLPARSTTSWNGIQTTSTWRCQRGRLCCMPGRCRSREAIRSLRVCIRPMIPSARAASRLRRAPGDAFAERSAGVFAAAHHAEAAQQRQAQPDPVVVRPLVRRHPRSGRKALYFGNQVSIGIVGWPEDRA